MRVKLKDLQTFFCGHLLNFSCETVIITHYMLVCRLLTTGNTLVFSLAVERTRQRFTRPKVLLSIRNESNLEILYFFFEAYTLN